MRNSIVLFIILFSFYNCQSIKNKKDLAGASSDIKTGKPSRIAEVEKVAMGEVPGLEKKAVEVISQTPGKEARDSLLRVAEKKTVVPKAKHLAIEKLGDRTEKTTGKLLLKKVEEKKIKDPAALIALGKLKEHAAVPVMKKALKQPEKTPQALRGLALLGSDESVSVIRELCKSGTEEQKLMAVKSLATIKSDVSRETLQNILKDAEQDKDLRLAALRSIATAGNEKSIPILREVYAKSKGEISLKIAMIYAIAKLKNVSEEEVLDDIRLSIWKNEYKKKPDKGKDKSLKGDGLTLKGRLKKITGNRKTAWRISKAFKKMSKMNSPSSQFVYKAYLKMYPDKSFSQIQAKMKIGLGNAKAFRTVLKNIVKEYPNKSYRILAIQRIFGLNKKEASRIYRAYKKGKI